VSPGGTGGTAGGNADQTIDAICRWLEVKGCGYTNCRQNLKQTMDTYELWGCGDEWLEGQTCRLRDPIPCGNSPYCEGAYQIYQKCIDEAEICVRGNPPEGGCVMACEQGWAVECKPNAGPLSCVCTSGRFSGRRFAVPAECQSEEWLKTIRANCE
jgi:hypothetical protein